MSSGDARQTSESRRVQLPLATDVERLVAVIMSPQTTLLRKLSAAERLYSLIPTYVWRMLTATAVKLLGREALLDDGTDDYKDRRKLYADTLRSILKFMDKTREKIVEDVCHHVPCLWHGIFIESFRNGNRRQTSSRTGFTRLQRSQERGGSRSLMIPKSLAMCYLSALPPLSSLTGSDSWLMSGTDSSNSSSILFLGNTPMSARLFEPSLNISLERSRSLLKSLWALL